MHRRVLRTEHELPLRLQRGRDRRALGSRLSVTKKSSNKQHELFVDAIQLV